MMIQLWYIVYDYLENFVTSAKLHYSGEVETLMLLYCKFTCDNTYQVLSELVEFCGRKNSQLMLILYAF